MRRAISLGSACITKRRDNALMPAKRSLTRTQKRLVADLDKIMFAASLDYWNILDRDPRYDPHRTIVLQAMIREIVRGEVVSHYTLIDEQLGSHVCFYMFPTREFPSLWKTKKFERFNYFILEKMSLMEKLAFVKDILTVPRAVAADIENINAIRNAVAHAFFPENLRAYRTKRRAAFRRLSGPHYKGLDIFTLDGFNRFLSDSRRVEDYLITSTRRRRRPRDYNAPPTAAVILPAEPRSVRLGFCQTSELM